MLTNIAKQEMLPLRRLLLVWSGIERKIYFSETPSIFHFSHRLTARLEFHHESRMNIYPQRIFGKIYNCFHFFPSIAKVPHYPWNWNIPSEIIFSLKKHEISCLVELTHCHCPDIFFIPMFVWLANPEHAPKYPKQRQNDKMTWDVLPKMLAGQIRDGCQVQCNDWLFKIFVIKTCCNTHYTLLAIWHVCVLTCHLRPRFALD